MGLGLWAKDSKGQWSQQVIGIVVVVVVIVVVSALGVSSNHPPTPSPSLLVSDGGEGLEEPLVI